MSNEELQRRYQAGDPEALEVLLQRNREAFQRKALIWVGSKDQNLADEGLSRFYEILATPGKQQTYDPGQPWEPWAFTVLRHAIMDVLRDPARRRERQAENETAEDVSGAGLLPRAKGESTGPGAVAELNELRAAMRECLQQLSRDLRIALKLYFWRGWTLEQIGRLFGVGIAAAHKRKTQALELMKACLARKGIEGGLTP
jgi:RNA polymerase sigma factor (sigma-70 family)